MNNSIRARGACKYLVCALLITGAAACDKAGFSYDNIVEPNPTNYIITDTITMNMSTVYFDSIPTSNLGVALCGINNDPIFGTTTASSYWQLRMASNTLEEEAIYDSITLVLHPNGYTYADTMQTQDISVYRVTEDIAQGQNSSFMYSHNKFATETQPLGSRQGRIWPSRDTTFNIKLDNALGQNLFTMYRNSDLRVSSQDRFLAFFKGLALKPGPNSTMINGFRADDSLVMRLHYHLPGIEKIPEQLDFTLYNTAVQFNNVENQRIPGTPLATLGPGNKQLPSAQAENRTFVQPLTHIATRIDMPYLKNLSMLTKFFKIMRATLTIMPEKNTYRAPYTLPPALRLCETDGNNNITDTLISPSTGAVLDGSLVVDELMNETTAYTYDITNYCIAEINSSEINSRGLMLTLPRGTGYTQFNRAVFGDSQNLKNRIRIQIYYLQYN